MNRHDKEVRTAQPVEEQRVKAITVRLPADLVDELGNVKIRTVKLSIKQAMIEAASYYLDHYKAGKL